MIYNTLPIFAEFSRFMFVFRHLIKNSFNNSIKIGNFKKNQLQINTNNTGKYKVDIFSPKGQLIKSTAVNLKAGQNSIAIDKLSSGCNFVRVSNGINKSTKKIILK